MDKLLSDSEWWVGYNESTVNILCVVLPLTSLTYFSFVVNKMTKYFSFVVTDINSLLFLQLVTLI